MKVALRDSIRLRVLALAVVPVMGLFGLLAWKSQSVLERFVVESVQSAMDNYAQTLNLALSLHLAAPDAVRQVDPFLQELVGVDTGGIAYLALVDEHGGVLARTDKTPAPLPTPDTDLSRLGERDLVHMAQPILLGATGVGTLRYGVSIADIRAKAQNLYRRSLLEGLAALLLLVLALGASALFVMLRLNRRLDHLLNTSEAIAGGNYERLERDTGRDEIAVLNHQMGEMAEAIRSRVHALQTSEQEIRHLNFDLASRNAAMDMVNAELRQTLEHLQQTQKSLVQAEKLAGLGSVVAAVAHELNTPIGNAMTVASGFADKTRVFQRELQQGLRKSVLNQYIEDSSHATQILVRNLSNAADLVLSFKHVAVDQTSSQRRSFELDRLVDDVLATLRPSVKKLQLEIRVLIDAQLTMDSYPGPLGQVLTNLFNNAVAHAFDESGAGAITIEAHAHDNDHVRLVFADNGQGIDPTHVPKLFDPFFTTKLGKGGSGLGLHIVYNLVTGTLLGEIEVRSQPGAGTEFILTLPRHPRTAGAAPEDNLTTPSQTA